MNFRTMSIEDYSNGFSKSLSALREVDTPQDKVVEIFKRRQQRGMQTFVMENEDTVVGTATLFIEPKYYRFKEGGQVAHVEDVAVDPAYQGRGYGQMMLTAIKTEALKQGCYKMILDCSEKNVPFYEKNGYKQCERQMRLDLI